MKRLLRFKLRQLLPSECAKYKFDDLFDFSKREVFIYWPTLQNKVLVFLGVLLRGFKRFGPILERAKNCGEFKRNPSQIWITVNSEAALNTLQMKDSARNGPLENAFNWSMSFSKRSTVYRPWFYVNKNSRSKNQTFSDVKKEWKSMNKSKDFCWLVSNCNQDWSKRKELANELIPLLSNKLHIWGTGYKRCLNPESRANSVNHGSFPGRYYELYEPQQKKMKDCKFYFAFDNAICSDFVTEKFSNALEVGAIPIVNGWRKSYEERVPGSFIHVSDFETMTDLASHLKYLLANEDAFMSYHKWRLDYEIERTYLQPACELCQKLKEYRKNPKQSIIHDVDNLQVELQDCKKVWCLKLFVRKFTLFHLAIQ